MRGILECCRKVMYEEPADVGAVAHIIVDLAHKSVGQAHNPANSAHNGLNLAHNMR